MKLISWTENGVEHKVTKDTKTELDSFKSKLSKDYKDLLENRIFRKNFPSTNKIIQLNYKDDFKEIIINKVTHDLKRYKLPSLINNRSDFETPLSAINRFNKNIFNRLIELWNYSWTFEELEFLLYHINNMPPLIEIELVDTQRMLIHKKIVSKNKGLNSIWGEDLIKLLDKLSNSEIDFENDDFLGILKELERKILQRENLNIEDREKIISYYLELLGYATSSTYSQSNTTDEYAKIGLCLKEIKKVENYIANHKEFIDYQSFISKCHLYEFENKNYSYYELLEKVYYHEFGHIYFGHTKKISNHVDNPNKTQESYANFFSSLIYNSEQKSFLIWLLTRFQPVEYKDPILLHLHPDINHFNPKTNNLCKLNHFCLYRIILREREKRKRSSEGIHQ